MSFLSSFGPFVGRVLIAVIFVWAGVHKLVAPGSTAAQLASIHVPLATAAAVAAGLVELLCALGLIFGMRARAAALVLFLYVAAATLLFQWPHDVLGTMKNLAIMGGLLLVAGQGPGPVSVNR